MLRLDAGSVMLRNCALTHNRKQLIHSSMATTQLSDIYVPKPFDRQALLATKVLSAFWQSGIFRTDNAITEFAQGPGRIIDLPKLRPLGGDRNVGSDNPQETSTPSKISTDVEKAIKHFSNNSWGQMDLAAALTDPKDPLNQLAGTVGGYWARENQKILIATLNGILADNIANDNADMVYDIATDTSDQVTPDQKVSHTAITRAKLTSGDALGDLSAIAVHSAVFGTMLENEAIRWVEAPNDGFQTIHIEGAAGLPGQIPYYGSLRVIVDDGMPVEIGDYRLTYTSILFGSGSIAYAEAQPKTPSEVQRNPDRGNGEGEEILYSRRHTVIHPFGFAWQDATIAGKSPTNAELALAANWDRVYPERKQVPLAFLRTNG